MLPYPQGGRLLRKIHRAKTAMLYKKVATQPKMMSIGLHNRIIGQPARAIALKRFLDYDTVKLDFWITRRLDIAKHRVATHPYPGKGLNE